MIQFKASQGAQCTYKVTDVGSFGSLPSLQQDLWPPLLDLTTIKRNKGGRKAAAFPWRPCPAGMKSRIRYRGKMYALSPASCGDHSRIKVILSSKSSQGGKKKTENVYSRLINRHLCVCVCGHLCMWVYMCVCRRIRVCVCVYVYVFMGVNEPSKSYPDSFTTPHFSIYSLLSPSISSFRCWSQPLN